MGRLPIFAFLFSVRIVGMYQLSSEMSKKYLVDNASGILRKVNPQKDSLLEKSKDL